MPLSNDQNYPLAKNQTPRQKKPYSRTRFGCRACKLRRIRCDEGLPICRNCAKASRRCERGPLRRRELEPPIKFKAPLTLSHFRPSSIFAGLEDDDMAYLDAFRYRLIDGIVGEVARPGFKRLMMQAIHQEPAIRHAAVAFGAAAGLVCGMDLSALACAANLPVPVPNKALALRHYDKCIKGVQRQQHALRINKPSIALRHLEHGLDILESNSVMVDDDLICAFSKLDIQATMFLGQRTPKTNMNRLASISMDACKHAETDKELVYLLGKTFTFFRTKTDRFRLHREGPLPPSLYTELAGLQHELQRFRRNHAVAGVPGTATVFKLPHQHQILWMTCLILHVMLSSCLCIDEMIYDNFLPEFEAISAMAEGMVRSTCISSGGYKDFHLFMSLLYPVFKTSQMCRSPSIRRRLITLMNIVSFDEGAWEGSSGQRYAAALMRLEEEGLKLDGCDLDGLAPSVIPQYRRIRSQDVQPAAAERYSTLFFRFSPESGRWDDLVEAALW